MGRWKGPRGPAVTVQIRIDALDTLTRCGHEHVRETILLYGNPRSAWSRIPNHARRPLLGRLKVTLCPLLPPEITLGNGLDHSRPAA